jgi:hypothetical protein
VYASKYGLLKVWWKYLFLFRKLRVFSCCCLYCRWGGWWWGRGGYRCRLVSLNETCFKRISCSKHGTCHIWASCGPVRKKRHTQNSSVQNCHQHKQAKRSPPPPPPRRPSNRNLSFFLTHLFGAFAKLLKATVAFVVCVLMQQHGWLPLDGFL